MVASTYSCAHIGPRDMNANLASKMPQWDGHAHENLNQPVTQSLTEGHRQGDAGWLIVQTGSVTSLCPRGPTELTLPPRPPKATNQSVSCQPPPGARPVPGGVWGGTPTCPCHFLLLCGAS